MAHGLHPFCYHSYVLSPLPYEQVIGPYRVPDLHLDDLVAPFTCPHFKIHADCAYK